MPEPQVAEPQVVTPENTEQGQQESQVVTPQYSEEEERAVASGWIPKEQWKGKPEDHRSAKEFNDRGEFLGKLKSQGQELREMKEMVRHLGQHNQRVYEAGYREAIKNLQIAKVEAIKQGEVETALAIDARIDEQKNALLQVRQQSAAANNMPQGPSPIFQDWSEKNPWYTQEASMRHWATGMAMEYARVNPGVTEQEIYDFLSKEVRKEFPQKFQRRAAQSPDGNGRQASNAGGQPGTDAFEALMAKMPEDEARAARNLVKMKVVSKEKYVADYTAIGGN